MALIDHMHKKLASLIAFSAIPFVLNDAMSFPVYPFAIVSALLIYGLLLSFYSKLWMLVLPAILPVFDLTPWSGRILILA